MLKAKAWFSLISMKSSRPIDQAGGSAGRVKCDAEKLINEAGELIESSQIVDTTVGEHCFMKSCPKECR